MNNWMFSHGDRVKVRLCPARYGADLIGRSGTVKSVYYNSVSVAIDGLSNNRGSTGLFYFAPRQLVPIHIAEEGEWAKAELMEYAQADFELAMKTYNAMIHDAVSKKFKNEEEEPPMLKNYKVAGIKFMDGYNTDKTYPYALYDENIAIGDTVVVMTGHHGMAIAEVRSIGEMPKDSVSCGREIICQVDMTAYNDRKAKAKKMAELN